MKFRAGRWRKLARVVVAPLVAVAVAGPAPAQEDGAAGAEDVLRLLEAKSESGLLELEPGAASALKLDLGPLRRRMGSWDRGQTFPLQVASALGPEARPLLPEICECVRWSESDVDEVAAAATAVMGDRHVVERACDALARDANFEVRARAYILRDKLLGGESDWIETAMKDPSEQLRAWVLAGVINDRIGEWQAHVWENFDWIARIAVASGGTRMDFPGDAEDWARTTLQSSVWYMSRLVEPIVAAAATGPGPAERRVEGAIAVLPLNDEVLDGLARATATDRPGYGEICAAVLTHRLEGDVVKAVRLAADVSANEHVRADAKARLRDAWRLVGRACAQAALSAPAVGVEARIAALLSGREAGELPDDASKALEDDHRWTPGEVRTLGALIAEARDRSRTGGGEPTPAERAAIERAARAASERNAVLARVLEAGGEAALRSMLVGLGR